MRSIGDPLFDEGTPLIFVPLFQYIVLLERRNVEKCGAIPFAKHKIGYDIFCKGCRRMFCRKFPTSFMSMDAFPHIAHVYVLLHGIAKHFKKPAFYIGKRLRSN